MKTLIKTTLGLSLLLAFHAYANDSTGYAAAGGIEYVKNKDIAMHSEDLYISKKLITVDYQFKNLSKRDITENILFPLARVPFPSQYSNFASPTDTINSFKILVNGKAIKPNVHVRAFVYPRTSEGSIDFDAAPIDVTEIFKGCGLTDGELKYPWTDKGDWEAINRKLAKCQNPRLTQIVGKVDGYDPEVESAVFWESQIIYSWQQTFKANTITNVHHSYKPMVGGSVAFVEYDEKRFCIDDSIKKTIQKQPKKYQTPGAPYSALGYILTTGANWAKPINHFKLTVERDSDELVSFCWAGKGKVTKVGSGKFQVIEKNFVPTKDLDVAFIQYKNVSWW